MRDVAEVYCLLTEQEHDGRAGVVGVLPGYEGRHHEPQQSREDSHDCQGCDGSKEDCELARFLTLINQKIPDRERRMFKNHPDCGHLIVSHGKDSGNEESLVTELRYLRQ